MNNAKVSYVALTSMFIALAIMFACDSEAASAKVKLTVKSKEEINKCLEEEIVKRKPKNPKQAIDLVNLCRRK